MRNTRTIIQRGSGNRRKNLIIAIFRREKQIMQAIDEYRQYSASRSDGTNGGQRSSRISSPTEVQALKNLVEVERIELDDGYLVFWPERWLKVIDYVRRNLNDYQWQMLDSRLKGDYYIKTVMDCDTNPQTYYNTINKAVSMAVAAACQLGIMRVIEE